MTIAENISWKKLQDKVVAVNITTGDYYTMNTVASLIWTLISEGKTEEEIFAQLKETFPDVAETVLRTDLDEQVAYWKDEKLLA